MSCCETYLNINGGKMKTYVLGLLAALLTSLSLTSLAADRVVINGGGVYPNTDVTLPEGSDTFVGPAPIFGGTGWGVLNIYLTEPGSNIISDHLYSLPGGQESCDADGNGADCIFFSSDPDTDASIGTACTLGSNFCLEENGLLQDVTAMVSAQNGGLGIDGGGSIAIQSGSAAAVPVPGTAALLGLGLVALGFGTRKRAYRPTALSA